MYRQLHLLRAGSANFPLLTIKFAVITALCVVFATGYGIIVTSSAVLCRDNEPFMIFSGGMARGSYGDKFTVSVIQGEKHVTFDFTSRVLDYTVLCKADEEPTDPGELSPHTFVPPCTKLL